MKKGFLLFIVVFMGCIGARVNAQSDKGLEGIIVEKYYISDEKDSKAAKDGHLPPGSVTYRIFVDMLPAYRLQAVYGVPGHELRISTTTTFFNNEEFGAAVPQEISSKKLANGTLMLDSWLSVGAAADHHKAIMKSDDTSAAIVNIDGILLAANPSAGIPISERDGMFPEYPLSVVTFFGMDSLARSVFGNTNTKEKGQVFSTDNASWASFGGAIGVHPMNKVLIAQLTTDGELSFKLNLQLGTPDGRVENYVAENPVDKEVLFPGLIYPPQKKGNSGGAGLGKKKSAGNTVNANSR